MVVGSTIVKFIEKNATSPDLPAALEAFTKNLTAPLRQA